MSTDDVQGAVKGGQAVELIDSHCHIDFPELIGETSGLLGRMAENGVVGAVCVSVKVEDFPEIRRLAEAHRQILATVGVHPDASGCFEPTVDDLVRLGSHPRVVAVGETGLDYFRASGDLEWQRARFRTHIRAAKELKKPLVIHTRASAVDVLSILREERADEVGGVMHCFTESLEVAMSALDLGMYISFSGILSFKNAEALREVARVVPANRLLIETDSPYLAPIPMRGKRNEPAFVRHVAEALANTRDVGLEDIARLTTGNFQTLFPGSF